MFLEANNLLSLSEHRKRSLFLTHCGAAIFKMAKALSSPVELKTMTWWALERSLSAHYTPQASSLIRRHEFYRRDQREGERISKFVTTLQVIANACEFSNMDHLVLGLHDLTLQSRLLVKPRITFHEAMEEAMEVSQKSAAAMWKMNKLPQAREAATVHYKDTETESEDGDEEEVHQLRSYWKGRYPERERKGFWCAGCKGNHPRMECRF